MARRRIVSQQDRGEIERDDRRDEGNRDSLGHRNSYQAIEKQRSHRRSDRRAQGVDLQYRARGYRAARDEPERKGEDRAEEIAQQQRGKHADRDGGALDRGVHRAERGDPRNHRKHRQD